VTDPSPAAPATDAVGTTMPATAASTGPPSGTGLDLARPHRLAEQVAFRREGFGALAYHFGNRRLTFLTSPGLVTLVRGLDGTRPLGEVLDAQVTDRSRPAVEAALTTLLEAEVLHPV
jgi:mycofactocin biosynthesis protein MftB